MEEKQLQANLPESEEEQEEVIMLLEERLEKHDENRKAIQNKFEGLRNKLAEQIDELEGRISIELDEEFTSEDDRLQAALNELRENKSTIALQNAKAVLFVEQSYEIIKNNFNFKHDLTTLYKLKTEKRTIPKVDSVKLAISEVSSSKCSLFNAMEISEIACDSSKLTEERERLIELLEERLEKHDSNRKAVKDKLHGICKGLRYQINELEDRVSKGLEKKFTSEDNRLQVALNELRENSTASALQKAKAELLVEQSYDVIENKKIKRGLTTLYELKAEKRIVSELPKMRKPSNVRVISVNSVHIFVSFTCFNSDEERVLSDHTIVNQVRYECSLSKKNSEQESKEYPLNKDDGNDSSYFFSFTPGFLEAETPYGIRAKMVVGDNESEWSDDIAEFTPEFKECCVWKKYFDFFGDKYIVDEKNPRIARIDDKGYYTIIGNTRIPLNKVTSWSIKILNTWNNGKNIYIGVAPSDINQDGINYDKCGWYFYCYDSTLNSGPPHRYGDKEYGPRKGEGRYVHTGDSVGVVMDTTKGELSFVLNNMNLGVAYKGIPLDKPLVPCVILERQFDSVELDFSEVGENVDSSITVPPNITTKDSTLDSIALAWDKVAGASFYQVEVDGSKSWDAATTNVFTKRGLLPETEHIFRVRTMRGSSVSEWSSIVKGRTLKASEFSECVWKKCPDDVKWNRKYSVDEGNPRVATMDGGDLCTIIGNAHIPHNTVASWSIKILKSNNNGGAIYIGIAPNDINQNEDDSNKCGWYFDCYLSKLRSGPPHNYIWKDYGPRKDWGQYVHTGDSVGVVVDTTNGELSFALNGVNLGAAYEGIPLDKPLVPCVLLGIKGDSAELII